jgi:hypothetical protein
MILYGKKSQLPSMKKHFYILGLTATLSSVQAGYKKNSNLKL